MQEAPLLVTQLLTETASPLQQVLHVAEWLGMVRTKKRGAFRQDGRPTGALDGTHGRC